MRTSRRVRTPGSCFLHLRLARKRELLDRACVCIPKTNTRVYTRHDMKFERTPTGSSPKNLAIYIACLNESIDLHISAPGQKSTKRLLQRSAPAAARSCCSHPKFHKPTRLWAPARISFHPRIDRFRTENLVTEVTDDGVATGWL